MRAFAFLLAAASGPLLSTSPLRCQSGFDLEANDSNFALRVDLAPDHDGWLTQRFPASAYRSLGQSVDPTTGAVVGRLVGYRTRVQDQDGSTATSVWFGVFADDPNDPDHPDPAVDPTTGLPSPAGLTGPIALPPGGPTGPVAWRLTISLQTPADVLPADGDVYVGVRLPRSLAWPRDGLSLQGAVFRPGLGSLSGPNPRALQSGAVFAGVHVIDEMASNAVSAGQADAVLSTGITTDGAALRVGARLSQSAAPPNGFSSYGLAGLYPDHLVRQDGLLLRIEDHGVGSVPGALAAVCFYWADQATPSFPFAGLLLPGLEGQLWIDATRSFSEGDVFALPRLPGPDGIYEGLIVAPASLPSYAAYGRFVAQGYVYDVASGRLKLTNAAVVNSL